MTIMLVRDSGRGYYRYRFKEFTKTFSSLCELAKFLSDNNNIYLTSKKQLSRKELSIFLQEITKFKK